MMSSPVSQVKGDWPDGGDSRIISRYNTSPGALSSGRCSPVIVPVVEVLLIAPVVLPVEADRVEARHIDSLPNIEELLRHLVGRHCEEHRPYRHSPVICLGGRLLGS